jgi:putative hydrolases of HD superfamily
MAPIGDDIAFIHEVDKLKNVIRKSRNISNERYENDAEHSWHACIMAMALQGHANQPVNLSRVLQMLIIHDLGEISCGDTIVYAKNKDHQKEELEAADALFSMLGPDRRKELLALFMEFEARESPDAKYAHAIDRTEPILQNIHNNGETWNANGISYTRIVEVNRRRVSEGSEELWRLLNAGLERMREDAVIAP